MRQFNKLKELSDYSILDEPEVVHGANIYNKIPPTENIYILRMLIKPKYSDFKIPQEIEFMREIIEHLQKYDFGRTGIQDSWCYVTIRHGKLVSETDDEFHFDGSSFRTDIIPERNYIWVSHSPTEYKIGSLKFPSDFSPLKYNLFSFADKQLYNAKIYQCQPQVWYLISPFCLHRRPKLLPGTERTFYRICFTDIEARDINNTPNPLIHTEAYRRDPVKTFRNTLKEYYTDQNCPECGAYLANNKWSGIECECGWWFCY